MKCSLLLSFFLSSFLFSSFTVVDISGRYYSVLALCRFLLHMYVWMHARAYLHAWSSTCAHTHLEAWGWYHVSSLIESNHVSSLVESHLIYWGRVSPGVWHLGWKLCFSFLPCIYGLSIRGSTNHNQKYLKGWRDGPAVESIFCSCRGPKFRS